MVKYIKKGRIFLKVPFERKDDIKMIPGRAWHPAEKLWSIPYNEDAIEIAEAVFDVQIKKPKVIRATTKAPSNDVVIKKLYEHQRCSVTVARQTNYFADLSEPGTGKTLVQIEMMIERNAWPILIVCPKSIMEPVWYAELIKARKELNFPMTPVILNNGSTNVKKSLRSVAKGVVQLKMGGIEDPVLIWKGMACIINYDMVPLVINELKQIPWEYVILDESTKIKNPSAKRSKAIIKLGKGIHYKSIMTGTLAPNGLQDAFNQFKFVNPLIFGESFYAFRQKYFTQGGYMNYEWFPRPESMSQFKRKIEGLSIQHHKAECTDLPPVVETIRSVTLNKDQEIAYEAMRTEALIELNKEQVIVAPFAITQVMKLRQIASGFIYNEDETIQITKPNPKITALIEIIEQLGGQKIVVFAHFNETIRHITEVLSDKYKTVAYLGNDNLKKEALRDFENDAQILVANPASAGHGLNLQYCSNICYFQLDFNLENYLQSMDRINRIGQKNKMTIYYIIAKKTIENYILLRLRQKQKTNKELDISELKEVL